MGFWVTLLWYALITIASMLLNQPKKLKPQGLGDFQGPTTTEGRAVPLTWGTVKMTGPNIIWYGDYKSVPIIEVFEIFSIKIFDTIVGYEYYMGVQFGLCQGPGSVIKRVWVADDLVWTGNAGHGDPIDVTDRDLFGGNETGKNGGVEFHLEVFGGTATQTPSDYISQFQKEGGKTPAYRGTTYVCPRLGTIDAYGDLIDGGPMYVGNSVSIKHWYFEVERIPNGLGLGTPTINSSDANPMNVAYEIMTNTEWGLGFPAATIDVPSFTAAATTLATEGNGFSFILDTPQEVSEILDLLQEQIDGMFFVDPLTNTWKCNLARGDYDIDTVPQVLVSNMHELKSFSRTSWEDTTNQIKVEFFDHGDQYKKTYALAQDLANQRIQGGIVVTQNLNFPGIKNATLANVIAWRELRSSSYPLAKAKIVVDRTFYTIQPAQVVALTDADLGFTKLPLRVTKIDFGDLVDNKITLDLVQDIYTFEEASFAPPPGTGWDPPADDLIPFNALYQKAEEAPYAFVKRVVGGDTMQDLIWVTARKVGTEYGYKIRERHSAGTPSGDYTELPEKQFSLVLIGQLDGDLSVGSAIPLVSMVIVATPDLQTPLEASFNDAGSLGDVGNNLLNLILVGDEFMLAAGGAQNSAAKVQLNTVYRGALDSVQSDHTAGDLVWVIQTGLQVPTSLSPPAGDAVDIKLLPFNDLGQVAEGDAITMQITSMNNRIRRPYCPSFIYIAGTVWPITASLEQNGSAAEDYAIDLNTNRRDFRTMDEVAALSLDAAVIFSDFPSANSTQQQVDVRNDPDGANTFLFTDTYTNAQHDLKRIDILRRTSGIIPTKLRLVMRSLHTFDGTSYTSREDLTWDVPVTSALTGQFAFGALDTNDVSNSYSVTSTGRYVFTLSSAFSAGDVEYRVDAGSWVTLIAAGNTTNNPALTSGTAITVRHTSTDAGALKQLDMDGPATDAFAILYV